MAITISILSTRSYIVEDGPSYRHAEISITDGVATYALGVGGLPGSGGLQAILDSRAAELWREAQRDGRPLDSDRWDVVRQLATLVADIDAYLATADTATAAEVRAEVKRICQRQRLVLRAIVRLAKLV